MGSNGEFTQSIHEITPPVCVKGVKKKVSLWKLWLLYYVLLLFKSI